MPNSVLGILGGGQLGSLLATSAKKLNIKTFVFSDDKNAPAKNFCDEFILGDYKDEKKIKYFSDCVDLVTFEFENIPFETLNIINKIKPVLPKPDINRIVQNRLFEKDLINKLNINTTQYAAINKIDDLTMNKDLLPGILKTSMFGYDGKGQLKINSVEELANLNIDFKNEYILENIEQNIFLFFSIKFCSFSASIFVRYLPTRTFQFGLTLSNIIEEISGKDFTNRYFTCRASCLF